MTDLLHFFIDFIIHIDKHLADIVNQYQSWTYLILLESINTDVGMGYLINSSINNENFKIFFISLLIIVVVNFLIDIIGKKLFKNYIKRNRMV